MRKTIALWLLCCSLFASGAQAQTEGVLQHSTPSATQYIGPGDIVPGALAWYGLRAYNRAYATGLNSAITIRRASDNTTTTLKILSTGALDTATATTFCNSTTCFVTQWFDQSGNAANLVQATNASQPQFFLSGGIVNGVPYIQCNSSVPQILTDSSYSMPQQPVTYSLVGGEITGSNQGTLSTNGGGREINFGWVSTNLVQGFASGGSMAASATDNLWHAFIAQFFSSQIPLSTSRLVVDTTISGFQFTGDILFGLSSITLCEEPQFGHASDAQVSEAGIWFGPFTDAQSINMNLNAHKYWGF